MRDEYLWNHSGTPDPDIVQLEKTLGQLAWRNSKQSARSRRRNLRIWSYGSIAALLALVMGLSLVWTHIRSKEQATPWELSLEGRAPVRLRAGERIDVSGTSSATLRSAATGEVRIEPDSMMRLLSISRGQQNFALDRGVIHALIWAPPAEFVVETPSAKTVDLGCQYTLRVGSNGDGFLTVETGWVAFQHDRLESFIPAGAACATNSKRGPGTPYFLDAPAELKNAISVFDERGDFSAIPAVLPVARPRDGLTLWHLLQRTSGGQREQVWTRFTAVVNASNDISREAITRGDQEAMSRAWDALKLGDTNWWREWKRRW